MATLKPRWRYNLANQLAITELPGLADYGFVSKLHELLLKLMALRNSKAVEPIENPSNSQPL